MSIVRIAWRSIQHRGFGSLLTIVSMALGVMLVVAVLTIHGVVSQSFKSNSSFGYDLIVGARGGSMQLTMNTVYYLSKPVENIPYEYYLAFCDRQTCQRELTNSIAYQAALVQSRAQQLLDASQLLGGPFAGPLAVVQQQVAEIQQQQQMERMGVGSPGRLNNYVQTAIPLSLGDYLGTFRVVGTKPEFFTELTLDVDTAERFEFAQGRAFEEHSDEHGYFEAVIGAQAARQMRRAGQPGGKLGDVIYPIHGDPNSAGAHTHQQGFTVVGILTPTGTPHDRAVFVNLEGFYLMEDHSKPIEEDSMISSVSRTPADRPPAVARTPVGWDGQGDAPSVLPLPIEQREVTAILVKSFVPSEGEDVDPFAGEVSGMHVQSSINEGFLQSTLGWSDFRPARAQTASQAVSPVLEITSLFDNIVSPVRWVLLLLTAMICVVSGISILVGIYNSMNQRRHEIAVIRALGASRPKVMSIMLMESLMLALAGGALGWLAGHGLNAAIGPLVESETGVQIGFLHFAPPIPVLQYMFPQGLFFLGDDALEYVRISPEFLLIPGLILLAIVVGIYPAISAYRTDVANSLGRAG